MKNKILNGAVVTIMALAVAMTFTACPQEVEVPTTEEIADEVMNRSSASSWASQFGSSLSAYDLTVNTAIKAWGQDNAEYTVKVNSAGTTAYVLLMTSSSIAWEGPTTGDVRIVTSGSQQGVIWTDKANDKSAEFPFTITHPYEAGKTIRGKLRVQVIYDATTVGIAGSAGVKALFESITGATATTPIAKWGTAAAYTYAIDFKETSRITLPTSFQYAGGTALVEWKPVTSTKFDISYSSSNSYQYVNDNYYSYDYTRYSFSPKTSGENATETVTFNFRINANDQTLSGTLAVALTYTYAAPTTPTEADVLKSLQEAFMDLADESGVLAFYADTPISAWKAAASAAFADATYTVVVGKYSWDDVYLSLPSSSASATWAIATTTPAGVGSVSSSSYYSSETGAATLNFTYTYAADKVAKGTLKVTVVDQSY